MTDAQRRQLVEATDHLDALSTALRKSPVTRDHRERTRLLDILTQLHELIGETLVTEEPRV